MGNRDVGNGMELEFIPPNLEGDVEFTVEDLDEGAELLEAQRARSHILRR